MSPRERLRSLWADRPTLVRASYVRDLEADLRAGGWTLPTRQRFERLRNLRFYRPVVTTYQRQLDRHADAYSDGFARGLDRAENATAAPSGRRVRAHRTTSTGVTLTTAALS